MGGGGGEGRGGVGGGEGGDVGWGGGGWAAGWGGRGPSGPGEPSACGPRFPRGGTHLRP